MHNSRRKGGQIHELSCVCGFRRKHRLPMLMHMACCKSVCHIAHTPVYKGEGTSAHACTRLSQQHASHHAHATHHSMSLCAQPGAVGPTARILGLVPENVHPCGARFRTRHARL